MSANRKPVPVGTAAVSETPVIDAAAAAIVAQSDQNGASPPDDDAPLPTIEARILIDHAGFTAGEFALLTEAEAASAEAGGWADLHEDAVAYAKANAA